MVRLGREVQSWKYYILWKDCCLFRNVYVRDPRHNLDHYMVIGCLHRAPLREHTEYLRRCMQIPIRPLTNPTKEDRVDIVA